MSLYLVRGHLTRRRHEVEEEENAPYAQQVQDLIYARDWPLGEFAHVVELLVANSDPNIDTFFRDDYQKS